jgi:hypothetical protein
MVLERRRSAGPKLAAPGISWSTVLLSPALCPTGFSGGEARRTPERAGFDRRQFCSVIKGLYLRLNQSNDKDLASLVHLLFQHGFLLS